MEFLIRVRDKVGSDIYHDVKLTKRGHVIVAMPDGHDWGTQELTNPDWRIVRVPGISEAEAGAMLASEPGLEVNRMLQRRAFKIDLDHGLIPKVSKDFLDDDSRKVRLIEIPLAHARFLKKQLQPVQDPGPLP